MCDCSTACQLPDGDQRHGTYNGYVNLSCRCDQCRAAATAMARKLKAQRVAGPKPDRIHGTAGGYGNWGCRCTACRDAWAEKAWRRRNRSSR